MSTKRLKTFDDKEAGTYDQRISRLSEQATVCLQSCEKKLGLIGQSGEDARLRENLKRGLAARLFECSKEMRAQQRSYHDRTVELEQGRVAFLEVRSEDGLVFR